MYLGDVPFTIVRQYDPCNVYGCMPKKRTHVGNVILRTYDGISI